MCGSSGTLRLSTCAWTNCPFFECKQGFGRHLGDTGTWYSSHLWRSHHSLWHPSLLVMFTDRFMHSEKIKGDWISEVAALSVLSSLAAITFSFSEQRGEFTVSNSSNTSWRKQPAVDLDDQQRWDSFILETFRCWNGPHMSWKSLTCSG